MRKKNLIGLSLLIFMFSLSACSGQDNKENKKKLIINTTEMETADFIYKNYNILNFEDDREELSLWDLKNYEIRKYIQEKYKNDIHLKYILDELEKLRVSFYQYSVKGINDDYKNYKYLDGPFLDYLVLKKDDHTKELLWKIIKDTSLNLDNRKEMLIKLKQYPNNKFIIKDPDGYSNLRSEPSASSVIIEKIKSNEEINVKNDNNIDWWNVESKKGNIGFIHISRIQIIL
ncbi:SH3 domain-containing protein [Apibacter raozihei]|uniref:SH3 domain-containing protein n=1 Tax=Apibacter raozihei TaxID=2500547 RepID=UPI000FE319B9|nr:SH3 domain-containing protein [Apibacter raozihei]